MKKFFESYEKLYENIDQNVMLALAYVNKINF